MIYPRVLGYADNEVLNYYREKFYDKLYSIFMNLPLSLEDRKLFTSLDESEKKGFLLHPDICSLVWDTGPESHTKLSRELYYFLNDSSEYTPNKGSIIPGTSIRLTDIDNNPVEDNIRGWGDRDEVEWLNVFGKAFALLKKVNKDMYDELNDIIKKIVVIGTSIDVHNSCSYKNCIGTLYLGYTVDSKNPEINVLEALIHESSHNKLNLIAQSEKLHINDYSLQYYSPYRPDARHINGVYLGVHAIAPTVYIMLQAIEQGLIKDSQWYEKVILFHIKNKLGLRVLEKHIKTTKIGKEILNDISEVISLCDIKINDLKVFQSINRAEITQRAKKHFSEVKNNYPHLQY